MGGRNRQEGEAKKVTYPRDKSDKSDKSPPGAPPVIPCSHKSPVPCPLDRQAVKALPPGERERIFVHLRWWRDCDRKQRLAHWGSYPIGPHLMAWKFQEWQAFYYEAAARAHAKEKGVYVWKYEMPICDLDDLHARLAINDSWLFTRSILEDFTLASGRISPSPGFYGPFAVNLTLPDSQLFRHLREWFGVQRRARGIRVRKKGDEVPWNGLEVFDREFLLGDKFTSDTTEAKRRNTALREFRKMESMLKEY